MLGEVAEQCVEGVGDVERWQPDPVRRGSLADHLLHRDVEQGVLIALLRHRGWCLHVVLGAVERLHLGDREGQDAAQVAALVASDPGPTRRGAGDISRLEAQQGGLVGLEVAETGDGRKLVASGTPRTVRDSTAENVRSPTR